MATYIYDSERELAGRISEFKARMRKLEVGITTDERGLEYTDPANQIRWFNEQIERMGEELLSRAS